MTQEGRQGLVCIEDVRKGGQIRWPVRSGHWWRLDVAWLWRMGSLPCGINAAEMSAERQKWEKNRSSHSCYVTYARKAGVGLEMPLGCIVCGEKTQIHCNTICRTVYSHDAWHSVNSWIIPWWFTHKQTHWLNGWAREGVGKTACCVISWDSVRNLDHLEILETLSHKVFLRRVKISEKMCNARHFLTDMQL